jgi:dolichol-phosphate mannosyltransferase
MRNIAIVVPVYNEGKSLIDSAYVVCDMINKMDSKIRIYYVNDGSTDGTLEVLNRVKESKNLKNLTILSYPINQGYGAALKFGARTAQDDGFWGVVFIDSDLTNPLNEIPNLIQKLEDNILVKASRYVPGAQVIDVPLKRRIFSVLGNRFLKFLLKSPIRDITNGFRAWRVQDFLALNVQKSGFDSIIEEFALAMQAGYQISEVPSILKVRNDMQRKSSASYTIAAILNYIKPAIQHFRFRVKVKFKRKT